MSCKKGIKRLEHGGNIHKLIRNSSVAPGDFIDFSANINPIGMPVWFRSLINRELENVYHYPDPEYVELKKVISEKYQIDQEVVIPANGTTELLYLLPQIIKRKEIIIPEPSYIDYRKVFDLHGFNIKRLDLAEQEHFTITEEKLSNVLTGGETVIFGNPVNPTGAIIDSDRLVRIIKENPRTLFIIDEAFYNFYQLFNTVGGRLDNVITLNSLTKFFAVPGLRIGFGIFPLKYGRRLKKIMPPWTVNSFGQAFIKAALEDEEYCVKTKNSCDLLRKKLVERLADFSELKVFPSSANYLLVKLKSGESVEKLYVDLLKNNIIIRRCGNYQNLGDDFFRVAVRTEGENTTLVRALEKQFGKVKGSSKRSKKIAKSLMFQGTSSNAGKSILSAALCRILFQDGIRVAPFKAQNMSLNSYVTKDCGEMGRAQVVQAFAAKQDPDWRMNPVLLKPNSHTGSQVIINGKPVGNMNVRQYHAYKEKAWKSVVKSYDELAGSYDCIILEGAGSPGEVNLKKHDFVNMKMAAYAKSPVLLVGDIDRGGVYASFVGIMDVLEQWERALLAGFVVNKFRGDQSLLDEAHTFVFQHTGKEVMGVIPFIEDLSVPQEDSVSFKDGFYKQKITGDDQIEIAFIDLPHISNFTDIDPLYYEPDVNITIVKNVEDLTFADAIIIPGSKNVGGDLEYLRTKGFYTKLHEFSDKGGIIVGICGGYQMLGRKLRDPHNIETTVSDFNGIGLIDIDTVLHPEKTLEKKKGIHLRSGMEISGYEIHHGITVSTDKAVLQFSDNKTCGTANEKGNVWGAYLHGLFDEDLFRRWFIDDLRVKKGLLPKKKNMAPYNIDKSLDELADLVRSRLDMAMVYQLINL